MVVVIILGMAIVALAVILAKYATLALLLEGLLSAAQNVPPDAYPGSIPAGYGGFPPGTPGSQLPRIPLPTASGGTDPYHENAENCRRIYNGINAVAHDTGNRSSHDRMVGGPIRMGSGDPMVQEAFKAQKACEDLGFDALMF